MGLSELSIGWQTLNVPTGNSKSPSLLSLDDTQDWALEVYTVIRAHTKDLIHPSNVRVATPWLEQWGHVSWSSYHHSMHWTANYQSMKYPLTAWTKLRFPHDILADNKFIYIWYLVKYFTLGFKGIALSKILLDMWGRLQAASIFLS